MYICTTFLFRFNSRARRGRDLILKKNLFHDIGFNSRARRGRDVVDLRRAFKVQVSIHAPVGGATASLSKANKQIDTALFLRCGQTCNGVLAVLNLFVVLIVWNLDVAICVVLSAVL